MASQLDGAGEGSEEGGKDGLVDGSPVGLVDGAAVGFELGYLDGFADGSELGMALGSSLGFNDGIELGMLLGTGVAEHGHKPHVVVQTFLAGSNSQPVIVRLQIFSIRGSSSREASQSHVRILGIIWPLTLSILNRN